MNIESLFALLNRLDKKRLAENAECADCGFSVRTCLVLHEGEVLCASCELLRRGLWPVEEHHLGGRPSPLTLELDANLHKALTVLQELWRGEFEPASIEAVLFDLVMLRILEPLFEGASK